MQGNIIKNGLSMPCCGLKVKTKLMTKFCLRPFMNPILSEHKCCLNCMTNFLTFKSFFLNLRQILELRPFVNPTPDFSKESASQSFVHGFLCRKTSKAP